MHNHCADTVSRLTKICLPLTKPPLILNLLPSFSVPLGSVFSFLIQPAMHALISKLATETEQGLSLPLMVTKTSLFLEILKDTVHFVLQDEHLEE